MESTPLEDRIESSLYVPDSEQFEALNSIRGLRHGFFLRVPGVDVNLDREGAIARLGKSHRAAISALGYTLQDVASAEQVHGDRVELVSRPGGFESPVGGADGLVTGQPGVLLAIMVADCCAVFLADKRGRGIALVHSGRQGSEMGIVSRAISAMGRLGIAPDDMVAVLSPCIRPPVYEQDFAAAIRRDCLGEGIPASQVHDQGTCTSSDLNRYYSYRCEAGKTGRMLALLGLRP